MDLATLRSTGSSGSNSSSLKSSIQNDQEEKLSNINVSNTIKDFVADDENVTNKYNNPNIIHTEKTNLGH